ncbi:MAG: acetylxylan esterase, partial [Planctomycetaceae bacterium]
MIRSALCHLVLWSVLCVPVSLSSVLAQEANYDEAKVPAYILPDLLTDVSGRPVTTPQQWQQQRRGEVLGLFEQHVFGRLPDFPVQLRTRLRSEVSDAIGGLAHRRELTVYFTADDAGPQMDLLIYTPVAAEGRVPAFLGLNFNGNQAIESDPRLHITESWVRNNREPGIENNRATEATRGSEASRWSVERIVKAGYGLVTIYYGDIDPDFDDGFRNGIHLLGQPVAGERAGDAGGSISAWAWGLSRALDVLQSDKRIDAERVAVFGHSRLGKTSLWAGATDPRFAMVISNNSGCGGAALSRRAFGETVGRINKSFPHWFCVNHRKYNGNEGALPVDHHMLIALAAPRPIYVASAVEDQWADPRGEYLSLWHAGVVYRLFGRVGMPSEAMPGLDMPVQTDVGYHIR